MCFVCLFFKQKTAYEMRISDWSSDVCSSDLAAPNVTFTSLTGEKTTMQDLRGKVVLVKFWATSCVTCIAQMPDTIQYYNDLSPKGFDTIAVESGSASRRERVCQYG